MPRLIPEAAEPDLDIMSFASELQECLTPNAGRWRRYETLAEGFEQQYAFIEILL